MLATDISTADCLTNWVSTVSPGGTFVKKSTMVSLPQGESGIPYSWTVVNDENVFNIVDGDLLVSGNFTFDGGMTWQEFVNSDYNIENKFAISYGFVIYIGYNGTMRLNEKYAAISVTQDAIIKPTDYQLVQAGGGGGGSD